MKWSDEENRLFFKLLEYYGTDFSMIEKVFRKKFKNRSKTQIKNKFNREEKKNPEKINEIFNKPRKKVIPSTDFATQAQKVHEILFTRYEKKQEPNLEFADIALNEF